MQHEWVPLALPPNSAEIEHLFHLSHSPWCGRVPTSVTSWSLVCPQGLSRRGTAAFLGVSLHVWSTYCFAFGHMEGSSAVKAPPVWEACGFPTLPIHGSQSLSTTGVRTWEVRCGCTSKPHPSPSLYNDDDNLPLLGQLHYLSQWIQNSISKKHRRVPFFTAVTRWGTVNIWKKISVHQGDASSSCELPFDQVRLFLECLEGSRKRVNLHFYD